MQKDPEVKIKEEHLTAVTGIPTTTPVPEESTPVPVPELPSTRYIPVELPVDVDQPEIRIECPPLPTTPVLR